MTLVSASPDIAVRVRGVEKSFGGRSVLSGIDIDCARGETAVVMGRSGTGKSVLLKILVGLIEADAGSVQVLGTEMTAAGPAERLEVRKRVGFLFQSGALFDSMTVGENVAFPLREHSDLSEAEIARAVVERLTDVGLGGDVAERMPSDLSGGMRKRVALARALVLEPEVLLYDEPTTGLDPITAASVAELILEMQARFRMTQIVVTHEIPLALKVATRLSLIYKGRLAASGTPEEFARSEDPLVKQFVQGKTEGPIEILETAP